MTTPTTITVAQRDLATLTGAELFGALAHAGLTRGQLPAHLEAVRDSEGNPNMALRGMRFLQAVALELALREDPDPAPSWAEAQRWNITAELDGASESDLEAERREYRVAAAVATGLSGPEAEQLPVLEVEAFARRRAGARG